MKQDQVMPRSRDAVPEGSVPGRRQILKGAGVGAAGMAALALSSPALARSRAAASQGTMPAQEPGLTDVVERVIDAGTAVIVTSQCHESEVLLGHYEAGDALARSGAVGSRDMTLEAAYAKVQFLLSQGLTGDDLAGWMGRSIAGELSP